MGTQGQAARGSRMWLQVLVNEHPDIVAPLLLNELGLGTDDVVDWRSPLADDEFREYHDQAFLDRIGIELTERPLQAFWPARGPGWDGLARTSRGDVLLVEAKAHILEARTPPSGAKDKASIALIAASLEETRHHLGGSEYVDWAKVFYQYTNRLAHLYLLRTLNGIPAWLIFLYFVGDDEMNGPKTADEWKGAIVLLESVLGLRRNHRLSKWVRHVFVDVAALQ